MADSENDTRTRLLDTAAALLWERSFHSTGVDEICKRAGVRRGSFYYFFPSKMDLAIEAVLENWQQVRDDVFEPVFRQEPSGVGQLHGFVDAVDRLQREEFERRGVYLGCPFGGVGQEMAHQDERLQAAVDRVFEEHVDYFAGALQAAAEKGQVEPGDQRQRARDVLALFEGALLVAKVANDPDRFTEVARALPRLIAANDTAD